MKKAILWLATFASLTVTPAGAAPCATARQEPASSDPQAVMRALTANLNLSASQRKKVDAIQRTQLSQMQELRCTSAGLSQEQLQQKGRNISTNVDAKIKAVLNATQYQQYQDNEQKALQATSKPAGTRTAASSVSESELAELTAGLSLTPAQRTRVGEIHANQMRQVETLRNSGSSKLSMMGKVRSLDAEAAADYRKVLSEAEFTRLQSNREAMRKKRGMPGR